MHFRAFPCQMRQETVGLLGVSSDIILPVPFFHYHDERRRLRNFVDTNTTWILAMAKCCDLLKFLYLCWCSYNRAHGSAGGPKLWFAEIFVPLLVQLQLARQTQWRECCCDLLKFLYLCWCSYNASGPTATAKCVVICWNFCTFAGAVTTIQKTRSVCCVLWFAEIFVPLLVQLQPILVSTHSLTRCDLLKFLYLCWCSYNIYAHIYLGKRVVICWNFCTFVGAVTTYPNHVMRV